MDPDEPTEETVKPQDDEPGLVVAVGASAGGLVPLQELLDSFPPETNAAFLVIVHQDPSGRTLLADLLGRSSSLPVEPAHEGRRIQPGRVYVAPAGGTMSLDSGVLHVKRGEFEGRPPHPIDATFRSLAADQGARSVGVVLSGNGSDGTLGLEAIRSEGGMTMVQDPKTAEYDGMPRSAIDNGCADYVLPVRSMLDQLLAYGEARMHTLGQTSDDSLIAHQIEKVIALVRARTGHDFAFYRRGTLRRRIARRMGLHQLQSHQAYVELLRSQPEEVDELFREMLIGVTSFFRDPEAFEALRPALRAWLERRPVSTAFRVWVPGCSTGEEAYSLAITLRECMDELGREVPLQIFATDLDPVAIERARAGRFPDAIAADLSAERLARFFAADNGGYVARPVIREPIVFAVQNVVSDPPFTRLDLLSCRNLLIYMTRELQDDLLSLFEYAIVPGGLLFLGSAETLGGQSEGFDTLDRRWNVFRRSERAPASGMRQHAPRPAFSYHSEAAVRAARRPSVLEAADQALLATLVPPTVIVNATGDVHHIHGRTGQLLEPSPGEPTMNLFRMARDGLQPVVVTLARRAAAGDSPVGQSGIRVRTNGDEAIVDVRAVKLTEPAEVAGLIAMAFTVHEPLPERAEGELPITEAAHTTENRVAEIERELRDTRETLQSTIEEYETANEELKSSNEELQSTNEELQSTNEELETAKEEQQSLNEELQTVNAELQDKVEHLSQAHDDMRNLLNSTEIATLFLDTKLRIKRYTPEATRIANLIQSDVGRPISDLVTRLEDTLWVDMAREVLRTLVFQEHEVHTADGSWLRMRIMPYRTAQNVIDGVVITFVDITALKELQERLERERACTATLLEGLPSAVILLDGQMRVVAANTAFRDTFQTERDEMEGQSLFEVDGGTWNVPALRDALERLIVSGHPFEELEVERLKPIRGPAKVQASARRAKAESRLNVILLAFKDWGSLDGG